MTMSEDRTESVDENGDTALHRAAIAGRASHVEKLLKQGASALRRNRQGLTAQAVAVGYDCRQLLAAAARSECQAGPSWRIIIFGNTNNYPLLLAEGLRTLGHQVRLCVNRPDVRHRPEAKYPAWKGCYPEWVIDCPEFTDEAIAERLPCVQERMALLSADADLVILNDIGPALACHFPQPKAVMLTGSDLTFHASYRSLDWRTSMWDLEYKRTAEGRASVARYASLVTAQRDGILSAESVNFAHRGLIPEGDELLDSIGVSDRRRLFMMMSDTSRLESVALPPLGGRLKILCGARIDWLPGSDGNRSAQDLKGTQVLLEGFARYCRGGGRAQLRLIRKGHDVAAAEALIHELGADEHVAWIGDELSLAAYHGQVHDAHLVVDQLAQSFPGMVTTDAYALGRPVMANFRNEVFSKHLARPLPGLQAASAAEVADQLGRIDYNRMLLASAGAEARRFAEDFLSPEVVAAELIARLSPLLSPGVR
jgi:hypothetical protein